MDSQELASFFRPPAWATGYISLEDAAFLDRMVLQVDPAEVIEVGVASGCSSALLLRSLAEAGSGGCLHSFDLAEHCYFDAAKPVGAAVTELVPELRSGWILNTGCLASDAGARLAGKDIALAFIDADHRHPWPALDLWALLPALAAGSWVALHDIALARVTEWKIYGPEILFEQWPGEKVSSQGRGNIGAIRLPEDKEQARLWLRGILRANWETAVDPSILESLAIPEDAKPEQLLLRALPEGLDQRLADLRMSGRQLVIWGAGKSGRSCFDLLIESGIRADAFVDRDKAKQDAGLSGLPVWAVEDFFQSEARPFALIASMFDSEISDELVARGFFENEDFLCFRANIFFGDKVEKNSEGAESPLLGMTSVEEQDYLFEYASSQFSNRGAIVDLGSWLGSTTIPLARGLEAAEVALDRCIQAYDTFIWQKWMDPFAGELTNRFQAGESFLVEFQRRLGRLAARVQVHPGDLTRKRWVSGGIEFLLVDAMKSWELCSTINRDFLTAVIPRSGLFMHQDFKFWGCPWIHLTMYRMRDLWEMERDLPNSPGTVFRLLEAPSEELLASMVGPGNFTREDVEAAYEYWLSRLAGPLVDQLRYARILALVEVGETEIAFAEIIAMIDQEYLLPEPFLDSLGSRLPRLKETLAKQESWEESMRRAAAAGRRIWLWGGGSGGAGLLRRSSEVRELVNGVIDSDPAKTGFQLEGVPVCAPEELLDPEFARPFVVIATSFVAEVVNFLNAKGWARDSDYCVAKLA